LCRAATMAVHAPYVTFVDLDEDTRPSPPHHHGGHRHDLLRWIAVIELEHHRIGLAAADAWMGQKVADHLVAVLVEARPDLRHRAPNVIRLVGEVVRSTESRMADAAVALKRAEVPVRKGECGMRLGLTAGPAAFVWIAVAIHAPPRMSATSRTVGRSSAGGNSHSE